MRYVIGLTGGIASGKSVLSAYLARKGLPIVDADKLARSVLQPGERAYTSVLEAFGRDYALPDGHIDRARLGALVFSDDCARARLNAITHPEILRCAQQRLDALAGLVVLDAPLLIETGMQRMCDAVWLVTADEQTRVRRICARDGLNEQQARARIRSQMSDQEKRAYATAVLDNSAAVETLYAQADALLAALEGTCKQGKNPF